MSAKKNNNDGDFIVPYHIVTKGKHPGCYSLHRPSQCRLKFPPDHRPIHKCLIPQAHKTYTVVPQGNQYRRILVPKRVPNEYPLIMQSSDYERLKKLAKVVTAEEQLEMMKAQERAIKAEALASEQRKEHLKRKQKVQPGAQVMMVSEEEKELQGPDQKTHTLSRAEALLAENFQGPKRANQVVLAAKCHAIRDAQVKQKELMKKALLEEERRLDSIMEENRVAAIKRHEDAQKVKKNMIDNNLDALKQQIKSRETAKIMEMERIQEESIRMNQANIAMQIDEANKMEEKRMEQAKLKEMLDQCNIELLYFKQLQNEEDRITDLRIQEFMRKKYERDAKNKAEANALKAAKEKGIEHIAKANKAEQELKEELERIRNLKIREEVEREFRRKEREAAIKKHKDIEHLHKARVEQIRDIHRTVAREIAKDELMFNNAARQNEEYLMKERELERKHRDEVEAHRQAIMRQINENEKLRAELRERRFKEGEELRTNMAEQEAYEKFICRNKIEEMRQQKVPDKYIIEVEQTLSKLKCI